ncbi:MAG: hypothetical protein M3367_12515 [Acidobacteriota bacterium]|nr:hypothetical protein [Acidobacteriota bacterium]
MKLSKRIFARCFSNVKSFPRLFGLFVGIIFLVLMAVTTGYSQSTFHDMWSDDSNVDENGNGLVVVGRGVSEINYVDEEGVEVETRITSPTGRTVLSGAFGEVSAQADARLAFDWDDIGDFTVRVERFPMCMNGYSNEGDDGILIRHGLNSTGGLWYRPTGYRRCPRNSFVTSGVFPVSIKKDVYVLIGDIPIGGKYGYGYCEYDNYCPFGFGICGLEKFSVERYNANAVCSGTIQCRTPYVRGVCRNRAKVCTGIPPNTGTCDYN